MRHFLKLFLFLAALSPAYAVTIDQPLASAAQEARAQALFREIRCVVCEGQVIADSPVDVAADMRRLVRQRIAAGDSDATIRATLASHYGDAVLTRPPMRSATALLWFGPLIITLLSIMFAIFYFYRYPALVAGSQATRHSSSRSPNKSGMTGNNDAL